LVVVVFLVGARGTH